MIKDGRLRRKKRIRAKISGHAKRPRISVFRSNKYIYAQAIDDEKMITLAAAFGKQALEVGKTLGGLLKKKKIKEVVFDRSGYQYHGRVKALAEALRQEGIKF